MVEHYPPIIFLIPWIILALIALSMVVQGWMIMNAQYGYSKSPKVKHPELNNVKAGDPLLVIKFTDKDIEELQQRILQQKMDELFEEPSTYEDDDDDDGLASTY